MTKPVFASLADVFNGRAQVVGFFDGLVQVKAGNKCAVHGVSPSTWSSRRFLQRAVHARPVHPYKQVGAAKRGRVYPKMTITPGAILGMRPLLGVRFCRGARRDVFSFPGLPLSGEMDCLVRVAAIDVNVSEEGYG